MCDLVFILDRYLLVFDWVLVLLNIFICVLNEVLINYLVWMLLLEILLDNELCLKL